MEFEKPMVHRVGQANFDDYRTRLATVCTKYGYSADKIVNDTELKEYIKNFVQENIIDHTARDALVGVSHRFAHMEISGNEKYNGVYPICHKYLGHNLVGTYVFYKDDDGVCHSEYIELETSQIIIP